jgi:hypothetical protein
MKPEGITDQPGPPWELLGAVRRDCEPHRGELVERVGRTAGVVSGLLAIAPLVFWLVLWPPWQWGWPPPSWTSLLILGTPLFPLTGVFISLAAWALARHDLTLIGRGRMGPAGEPAVQQGRLSGVAGMAVAGFSFLVFICLLLGGL